MHKRDSTDSDPAPGSWADTLSDRARSILGVVENIIGNMERDTARASHIDDVDNYINRLDEELGEERFASFYIPTYKSIKEEGLIDLKKYVPEMKRALLLHRLRLIRQKRTTSYNTPNPAEKCLRRTGVIRIKRIQQKR